VDDIPESFNEEIKDLEVENEEEPMEVEQLENLPLWNLDAKL
jgi:hypothetical protein